MINLALAQQKVNGEMQQSDVINFLSQPSAYREIRAKTVERIETHISIVFLVGEYAYKLKRAIALPFVDFRSLDVRKENCLRELEINADRKSVV